MMIRVPDAAVSAAIAEYRSHVPGSPGPGEPPDKVLLRLVLAAALEHLPVVRPDLHLLPWRQGRHEPRHLYAQPGPEPSDDDPVVGTLDTPAAALEACEAHNQALAGRKTGGGLRGAQGVLIGDRGIQNNRFSGA